MFPTSYVFLVFPYLAMFPEISVRILKVKNPKKGKNASFWAFLGVMSVWCRSYKYQLNYELSLLTFTSISGTI
jgi:hypothetical protein